MTYYHHLDWFNREEYTNYFNNEFIPKHIPDFNDKQRPPWRPNTIVDEYWIYYPNQIQDAKIFELQNFLKNNFDFPDIAFFLIFYQLKNYEMHDDRPLGSSDPTYATHTSLNLQLSGYEGTSMQFYEKKPDAIEVLPSNVNHIWVNNECTSMDQFNLVDQFDCTNTWSLINTGRLHRVVVPQTGIPKICIAFRFKGNPTFEDSLMKIKRTN